MKSKILITGVNGFVGRAVVEEICKTNNYQIYGLGRSLNNLDVENLKKYYQADVGDQNSLKQIEELKKIDVVIHAAGLAHQFGGTKKEDFWRVNVEGTTNICKTARNLGAEKIVLISSVSVYGNDGGEKIDEKCECHPAGDYAQSKYEAENRAIEFCKDNSIGLIILRLATVIGEGDRGNTTRLITSLCNRQFFWIGKGTNKKSLIYKNDAAKGILKSIDTHAENKIAIYNLTGEAVAMKDIVDVICRQLGRNMPQMRVPENLVRTFFRLNEVTISSSLLKKYETTFEKWLSDDIFSGQKFFEVSGYNPPTPIEEALSRQVEYYLKHKTK